MQYIFIIYIYIYIYLYIYNYLYIYIYLYISIYIYIYILKKITQRLAFFCKRTKHSRVLLRSLRKNVAFFAFFYVLCKRTLHSLRSFTFFAKECCVLCVLLCSLQKNVVFVAFLRKEPKRTHCSFGFHKLPKTRKKERKRTFQL